MKKQILSLAILCFFSGKLIHAQSSEVIRKYIAAYKDIAIEEEIRTGVPAAITLAQGIHETGAGTSDLVRRSNNHFGIKCKTEWTGDKVYHDDDARGECFRKYPDPMDSYRDHSDFLKNRPYYASLFNLDPTDYRSWAFGLKKAGYATNPKYPQILIKLIEDYELQEYTLIALGRKSPRPVDPSFASNTEKKETEAKPAVVFARASYPSGLFHINDTKVVFVPQGSSYLMVAEEHRISLSRLFEFNDMKPVDIALRDGLIYLQRKRKQGAREIHEVQPGETLHDIAQAEGLRIENLMEYNMLKLDMQPMTGEKLYLRDKAPSMPRLAGTEASPLIGPGYSTVFAQQTKPEEESRIVLHTVQPKETLYAIAKKYSVAVNEVLKWNELQSNDLKTGQQLRIHKRRSDASN